MERQVFRRSVVFLGSLLLGVFVADILRSSIVACKDCNPRTPEEQLHLLNTTPNAAHISDPFIRLYKNLYPLGTDPDDPDPTIHITSCTEFQPNIFEWFPGGSAAFEKCPNLAPWMKCSYAANCYDDAIGRQAHALLFHPRHMNLRREQFTGLPTYRDPSQKWIFYESEAPPNTWSSVDKTYPFWTMFNITSTITSDSDIPLHHIHMKCAPKKGYQPKYTNYSHTKHKMAAWFVSHCESSSKREVFAEELKQYFRVDIYGDCGNTSACNRHGMNGYEAKVCMFDMVENEYWFYLSFENAFCDEYVTEKFHRMAREANVIPVVLGAADYANILPKGSYIDIRDFKTIKELAEFMLELIKDPVRYNSYIERKNAHTCDFPLDYPCTLCEYLHKHRHETQIVFDAQTFWSVEQRCVSPKDFYRTCAPEIIPKIHYDKKPDLFL
jgi:hypothetical protein